MAVVRSFGNFVTGIDEMTPYIINETDPLIMRDYLDGEKLKILTRNDSNIVKELCWMISNITASTQDQVMKIINVDIIPLLQQIFVEIQVISTYGYVQNSQLQAYICDQSGCRINYIIFILRLFCFRFVLFVFFMLFYCECYMCFPKTFNVFGTMILIIQFCWQRCREIQTNVQCTLCLCT